MRITFPGACCYHVTAPGDARQRIYRDDRDREPFLGSRAPALKAPDRTFRQRIASASTALQTRPQSPAELTASGPLHAHLEGFDLHAAVAVPAGDRDRLEHLCRYVLRPPIAQERLELTAEGKVLLRLRRRWGDGTRAIRFEPTELLEKLASMIPKPRINLLVYHGVLAPHARQRSEAVRRAPESGRLSTPPGPDTDAGNAGTIVAASSGTEHGWAPASARPPPPAGLGEGGTLGGPRCWNGRSPSMCSRVQSAAVGCG